MNDLSELVKVEEMLSGMYGYIDNSLANRFLDVLHNVAAKELLDHPEIVAYHPRAIIVIGRSQGWEEEKLRGLHGLNRRLAGITVMTYDHLLAQGERLVEMLQPQEENMSMKNLSGTTKIMFHSQ